MMTLRNFVLLAVAATGALAAPIDTSTSFEIITASGPITRTVAVSSSVPTPVVASGPVVASTLGRVANTETRPPGHVTPIPGSPTTVVSRPPGHVTPIPGNPVTSTAAFASGPITTSVVFESGPISNPPAATGSILGRDAVAQPAKVGPTPDIAGGALSGVLGGLPALPALSARQLQLPSGASSIPPTTAVPSVTLPCSSHLESATALAARHIMTDWPPRASAAAVHAVSSLPSSVSPLPSVSSVPTPVVPRDVTGVPSGLPKVPAAVPLPPLNRAVVSGVPTKLEFNQVGPVAPSAPVSEPPSMTTQIRI
ncbi:uncharacterized protein TRAVEDRAFT_49154 [Trametes versicolor FP-101664 SS1]|uniref:uncharacterized protein n=1 Tax=Trametes versicolor (strain FP-101664) TaxID=717944 RepID=UPI0004622CE5|nr:uncharacterized protein TRAVEDRAFT_49154 [Trametes versicolor FP-101664 SS1]EIW56326.1 hypothetical protein TRAVEDRAFT_49154 [Trametes versicolor FP-101664 SS1]